MRIRVCRAGSAGVRQVELDLNAPSTAGQAVLASGLVGADWQGPIGVHGLMVPWNHLLEEGDRVEILHPLPVDPRTRRRARAEARRRKSG
jgi:putative ubiquitin-RnfH superfamily antitoxin RatB of RatAB toxin-antitoxin module